MTEEEQRYRKNAYMRQWYELNLEKQRKKGKEKYHRNKEARISRMTEKDKTDQKEMMRIYHKIHYWKQRGIFLSIEDVKSGGYLSIVEIKKKEIAKLEKEKRIQEEKILTEKHLENLRNFQKPKYSVFEIIDVLRKHIHHRLNNKQISKWDYLDWADFEKLKINNNETK